MKHRRRKPSDWKIKICWTEPDERLAILIIKLFRNVTSAEFTPTM